MNANGAGIGIEARTIGVQNAGGFDAKQKDERWNLVADIFRANKEFDNKDFADCRAIAAIAKAVIDGELQF